MWKKLITLFMLTIISNLVDAATPPRSIHEKDSNASDIVIGLVKNISHHDIHGHGKESGFVDRHYSAKIQITSILKGCHSEPWEITVTYWKPEQRPTEWLGPQGQNGHLTVGDHVKLWLQRQDNGGYHILEPNGIEWLHIDRI